MKLSTCASVAAIAVLVGGCASAPKFPCRPVIHASSETELVSHARAIFQETEKPIFRIANSLHLCDCEGVLFGAGADGSGIGVGGSGVSTGAGTDGTDLGAGAGGTDLGAGAGGTDLGAGAGGSDLGAGAGGSDLGAGGAGTGIGQGAAEMQCIMVKPNQYVVRTPTPTSIEWWDGTFFVPIPPQ